MSLKERLGDWHGLLGDEFQKDYMKKIAQVVKQERQKYEIYPKSEHVFNAYYYCQYKDVKVVILGQD